jgi:hypothetical protein
VPVVEFARFKPSILTGKNQRGHYMGVSTIILVLLAFVFGLVLGILWVWWFFKRRRKPAPDDVLDEPALAGEIGLRLAGTPADGSDAADGPPPKKVIWIDAGDEVLVHLDSTRVKITGRTLLVSVDLETDQTGRAPVIVAFAISDGTDAAGLVATTDEVPHGHPLLASRWGASVRASVWNSLLGIVEDNAARKGLAAASITALQGQLQLGADAPLHLGPRKAG